MSYPVRLKLYNSTGDKSLTIDQSGEPSGDVTVLDTERGAFSFNKPCSATEFTNSNGASLSLLDGLVGEATNIRSYLMSNFSQKGSSVLTVSSNGDYTSIQSAVDASDDGGVVYILGGIYSETVTLDPLKSVTLIGESSSVVIQSPSGISSDAIVLNQASSKDYSFKGLTVMNSRRGIFSSTVSSGKFTIEGVTFKNCGWDGTSTSSEDSTGYSDLWNSANTSDGAAIHIVGCASVSIRDVDIETSARGIFLQDIASGGRVLNSSSCNTLGTALELASSSGTGTAGCNGVDISNCRFKCSRGHGIKVVGGGRTKIYACNIEEVSCSGVLLENTLETDMVGTTLVRNNLKDFNGFGLVDVATGSLSVHGMEGVSETPYVLNASGCTFSCGGSGTQAQAYAVYAENVLATVNISGCGYICFDPLYRANDLSLVTDAQLGWITSQLHEL